MPRGGRTEEDMTKLFSKNLEILASKATGFPMEIKVIGDQSDMNWVIVRYVNCDSWSL